MATTMAAAERHIGSVSRVDGGAGGCNSNANRREGTDAAATVSTAVEEAGAKCHTITAES
jgi:hypothetical protein